MYRVSVRATNFAGYSTSFASTSFIVDLTPPYFVGNASYWYCWENENTIVLGFGVVDSESGVLSRMSITSKQSVNTLLDWTTAVIPGNINNAFFYCSDVLQDLANKSILDCLDIPCPMPWANGCSECPCDIFQCL
jgi:hypothetical protein